MLAPTTEIKKLVKLLRVKRLGSEGTIFLVKFTFFRRENFFQHLLKSLPRARVLIFKLIFNNFDFGMFVFFYKNFP